MLNNQDRLGRRIHPILGRILMVILVLAAPQKVCLAADFPADEGRLPDRKDMFFLRAIDYLERYRREDIGQAIDQLARRGIARTFQAIRLFNRMVAIAPSDPRGHAGLAEVRALKYLWGWEPDPAALERGLRSGRRAVTLAPDSSDAHLGLGIAYMASERYTPGLAELDRAVALDDGSLRAHLYRGSLLRGLRRIEEARKEARRTIELAPASPVAHTFLGDCELDQRHFTLARASYFTAAELDQRLLWPRLGIAASYQRETNLGAAERTYLIIEKDFPEEATRVRILVASMLVSGQRYDDALTLYQGISEKEALSPPLLRRLMQAGRAYSLEKLERQEEAEYFWNQLVEEFPSGFDGGRRDREVVSQAFETLARIYDAKGESKRSDRLLEKACQEVGMSFSLYASLAERQRSAGKLEGAVSTVRQGLKGLAEDEDMVTATQKVLPIFRSAASGRTYASLPHTTCGARAIATSSLPAATREPDRWVRCSWAMRPSGDWSVWPKRRARFCFAFHKGARCACDG